MAASGLTENQQLALDTIDRKPVKGIPTWEINPMEWRMIDRFAEMPEGSYQENPVETYRKMYVNIGVCMVDQWIPTNPLSMGSSGYEADTRRGATTGAEEIVRDGMPIREPEDVVAHMETHVFPALEKQAAEFDEQATYDAVLEKEKNIQEEMGPTMLKAPYANPFARIPGFAYGAYGYVNYFSAYALYPEVMEKGFKLQADLALRHNTVAARVIVENELPKYIRLDHDMADSRGTLVDIASLDEIWFPHLERCLQPFLKEDVLLIWHCDGNLSQMVPRLLDIGLRGFQGFQYEDGMDYEKICSMRTKDGDELFILAGVSVTTTLPHGSPQDVRDQLDFLVQHGPKTGLILGASSSITPGVPWENLKALADGFAHYREHGRG